MSRWRAPEDIDRRIRADLSAARLVDTAEDVRQAWHRLEEAHVLSQPWAWPHVKVHGAMLALGWRTRDRREVTGQILRLVVAGPGSLTGRYPTGNTGRANVSATLPMPVPDQLQAILDGTAR